MSYNTSDNNTVIQTQLSSSISSYTVSSEPGVTYYITVRAVNAVGPGDINGYAVVNGKSSTINNMCKLIKAQLFSVTNHINHCNANFN